MVRFTCPRFSFASKGGFNLTPVPSEDSVSPAPQPPQETIKVSEDKFALIVRNL